MKAAIDAINEHPRLVSLLGTVSGWASVDLLRASQIGAALLASLLTICSLILVAPKVVRELARWFSIVCGWFSKPEDSADE